MILDQVVTSLKQPKILGTIFNSFNKHFAHVGVVKPNSVLNYTF